MVAIRRSRIHKVDLDEVWMMEWFEFGYRELCKFLAAHAAYECWCEKHHRLAE